MINGEATARAESRTCVVAVESGIMVHIRDGRMFLDLLVTGLKSRKKEEDSMGTLKDLCL
jgi:hypothetical protein